MLIMRPDQDSRPERYFPYYSTGPKRPGDSFSRRYFSYAGADASIDDVLDIKDDPGALFGKIYDFSRYIAATGTTYISKTFFIPGSCIASSPTWDDTFTVMTKIRVPAWPLTNLVSLFSFMGSGFRGSQFQYDIALNTDGRIQLFANNDIGARFHNQEVTTSSATLVAGQRMSFCFVCRPKRIIGNPTMDAYADGVHLGQLVGDTNEGWFMNEYPEQPWPAIQIGLGGGNLYNNSQHDVEYLALWEGEYASPATVVAGGAFETELQNQAASPFESWPPVANVEEGTTWQESTGASSGTLVIPNLPPVAKVIDDTSFGVNDALTGTYRAPETSEVESGVGFGADSQEIGSYVPTLPPDPIVMVDLEKDREDIIVLLDSDADDDDLMVAIIEDDPILVIIEEKL